MNEEMQICLEEVSLQLNLINVMLFIRKWKEAV